MTRNLKVVLREEWLAARKEPLVEEKDSPAARALMTDWTPLHHKYDENGFVDPTGGYMASLASIYPLQPATNL